MPNPVVYFEALGNDYAGLQQYYRDLFGWKITQLSPGDGAQCGQRG